VLHFEPLCAAGRYAILPFREEIDAEDDKYSTREACQKSRPAVKPGHGGSGSHNAEEERNQMLCCVPLAIAACDSPG
jgi:hypothetical protein